MACALKLVEYQEPVEIQYVPPNLYMGVVLLSFAAVSYYCISLFSHNDVITWKRFPRDRLL